MNHRYSPLFRLILTLAALSLSAAVPSVLAGPPQKTPRQAAVWGNPGPWQVAVSRYTWQDAKRRREVPVKIYYPASGPGPFPVVLVSHGLGGSREGYEYLGRHLASHGYVAVHLQHRGSDRDAIRERGSFRLTKLGSLISLANSYHRPLDLRFAVDQLEKMNRSESPLKRRLDLARVGAAGHSYGAYTVLAAAGLTFPGKRGRTFTLADPRIKAIIPMSAPVPRNKSRLSQAYGQIRIPSLHMTGTRDDSPIGGTKAHDRRLPFDHINGPDQYLMIFKGGDHMVFSGRPRLWPGGENDQHFQKLIRLAATAFLEAYLQGDEATRQWLSGGGLAGALGQDGVLEMKLTKP